MASSGLVALIKFLRFIFFIYLYQFQTVGVFCHYWYKLLDSKLPGRNFKMVAKKVLVDQTIASPIVIFLFFATLGVMRRESVDETMEEIRHKFLRLYKAEWIGKAFNFNWLISSKTWNPQTLMVLIKCLIYIVTGFSRFLSFFLKRFIYFFSVANSASYQLLDPSQSLQSAL